MKEALRFALAAAVCAPKLALEDTLRHFNVHVPEKGLLHNDEGKSFSEIWKEAGIVTKFKEDVRTKLLVAVVADLRRNDSEMGKVMRELGLDPKDSPVFLRHIAPAL